MESYSFNLVDQSWIPVRINGELKALSLEQTLLRAREIERLEDGSPLVLVALHRLLLAVLYRALKGPATLEDNQQWIEAGQFPGIAIQDYLKQWKHKFDLFSPQYPFYQVHDLEDAGFNHQPKSWVELSPEIRDGGQGADIFNHENRIPMPITASMAAVQLLVRQTFATGGTSQTFVYSAKRSPSPYAIFVIPHGQSLLETLCFSLDPNNFALYKYDQPIWEREKLYDVAHMKKVSEEDVMGCAQAYTWMSRSIKLVPTSVNGQIGVEKVYLASGVAPLFDPERYYDPMVGVDLAESGINKGKFVFPMFRSGREFWRDFDSLFTQNQDGNHKPPRVISIAARLAVGQMREVNLGIYGMSNSKSKKEAKVDFSRLCHYLLPEAIMADRASDVYSSLEEALGQAEDLGKALGRAVWQLARLLTIRSERSLSDEDRKTVNKRAETFSGTMAYWSKLDSVFPQLLHRLTADYHWQAVRVFWLEQLIEASNHAWGLTRRAAGEDAPALKAVYASEGILRDAQSPILKVLKTAKEVA